MYYRVFFLTLMLFLAKTTAHGQVWLPADTIVPCNSTLTIQANASSVSAGTGSYQVSSIPFDSTYFIGTGSFVSTNYDDYCSDTIDLPFDFSFFDNLYSKATISGNGYLSFDLSQAEQYSPWSFTGSAPASYLPQNSIFGVYHDINFSVSGNIFYRPEGVSPNQKFIIEFHDIPQYSCNYLHSSTAIVLHESNIIDVHVMQKPLCATWNSGNALLAIQNATGDSAFVPAGRNTGPWSATHEAWRFAPNAPCDSFKLQWYIDGFYVGISDSIVLAQVDSITNVRVEMISYCSGQPVISASDEMLIMPQSTMSISPIDTSICFGESVLLSVSGVADAIWSTGDTTLSLQLQPSTDTTLYIQSYNSGACTQFIQTSISVNPLPDTPAVVLNDTLLLIVSDIQGVIWYLNDSALEIASSDTLEVLANGLYYALNYNEFGCSSSSDTITIATVSVQSVLCQNEYLPFPNPTNGVISFSRGLLLNGATISLYSSTGIKLMSEEVSDPGYTLDLRPLLRESTICHIVINAGTHGIYHFPIVYIR